MDELKILDKIGVVFKHASSVVHGDLGQGH